MKVWTVVGCFCACSLLGLAGFWFWPAPDPAPPDDPWFEDVAAACGVDFVHEAGDLGLYLTTQQNGSGVALFDFDGDGWLDIYLLTHGGPDSQSTNRLYKNMRDGTFKKYFGIE